jgi:hypothetical protein
MHSASTLAVESRYQLANQALEAVELRRYEECLHARWDEFVQDSRNGTLYHTRRFLSYHPPGRFEDHSLYFVKDGRWLGVLPAVLRESDQGLVLSSHPGASYGGLVLAPQARLQDVYAMLTNTISYAEARGCAGIHLLRLPPVCYHRLPAQELDFALTRLGFQMERRELSSVIEFTPGLAIEKLLTESTAYSARKAARAGLTIAESSDFPAFWEILSATLWQRHEVRPTHTLEEIQTLRDLWPDRIKLFGAFQNEKLIAGVVIFVCNARAFYTMYIAQDFAYQELRPLKLLLPQLMRWGQANGFRFIDLGISTESAGTLVNWGLFQFKESFGARGLVRDSYILNLTREFSNDTRHTD